MVMGPLLCSNEVWTNIPKGYKCGGRPLFLCGNKVCTVMGTSSSQIEGIKYQPLLHGNKA
jgi:hypothetical protein